jgi:2'-5' RNA ligase
MRVPRKGLKGSAIRTDRLHLTLAFTPHVTLAYGDQQLPEQAIGPVSWRAADFVLIHSELGRTKYNELGRWSRDPGTERE